MNLLIKKSTEKFIRPTYRCLSTKSFTFDLPEYKLHHLENGPTNKITLSGDELLKYLRQMLVIRQMETAASELYKAKFIRGFCHLYMGQEAIAVGLCGSFKNTDSIITSYRCHGFTYLRSNSVLAVLAELLGRSAGVSKGKGGSMHMFADNFYGGNGIVGAQAPLGAGLAFAHKYRNDGGVTATLYGDGAANQGQIFEAYNMAKLWDLPCLFICENNRYGMGTSQERSSASHSYYTRGDYIPGIQIDGMNVLAVKNGIDFAAQYCRDGKGPLVIEMVTYRYSGHSMSDPGTSYRTREEVKEVRSHNDPIDNLKHQLLKSNVVTEDDLHLIEDSCTNEIDDIVEQSKKSPEIGLDQLYEDVLIRPLTPTRGCDAFTYVESPSMKPY